MDLKRLIEGFNPYFIGLPILINKNSKGRYALPSFNPYFIGLPILISFTIFINTLFSWFQSLFYWITYSY